MSLAIPSSAQTLLKDESEYHQLSEFYMHHWLVKHKYLAVHEGASIVLAFSPTGQPKRMTLPDFHLPKQNVFIELTVCRWKGHDCARRAQVHRRELKFKRRRASCIRSLGYGYVLVEGDWYREIMQGCPKAIERFHWVVKKEARRTKKQAARVRDHQQRYDRRSRQPIPSRRQAKRRSHAFA